MQIVISFALFPVIVITYCLLFSVSPCPLFKYKMGFPFFFVLFSNPDTFLSVSKGCVGFARVVANVTEVFTQRTQQGENSETKKMTS